MTDPEQIVASHASVDAPTAVVSADTRAQLLRERIRSRVARFDRPALQLEGRLTTLNWADPRGCGIAMCDRRSVPYRYYIW